MATMLGTTGGLPEFEGSGGWSDYSSRVQAVCDWYGPTNFLQMDRAGSAMNHDAADSPESLFIGGPIQDNQEQVSKANPITYVTSERQIPPFLIVHGDEDPLVPFNQSELLAAAFARVGADYRFHRVVRGGHGGPSFQTPEVRELADEFFDTQLRLASG
jgi:acetyl esterase/lipase